MAKPATVLLIDDEPTIAKLLASALSKRGYKTIVCHSANEALEARLQHKPDLIISDVQMPRMSGFDLAEHLTSRQHKDCPFVFFTADDYVKTVGLGLQAGGDDFLIKGQPIPQILKRVSFWTATRFTGLPLEARVRALDMVAAIHDQRRSGVVDTLQIDFSLLDRTVRQLKADLGGCPLTFGQALIERILFLGRARGLLMRGVRDLGGAVRFPDMLVACVTRLNLAWSRDVGVLMRHYDRLSEDQRFLDAGDRPLVDTLQLLDEERQSARF